jgi:hypothetical protein
LQVESNEYPSDYPTIGYGYDPQKMEVVYDPKSDGDGLEIYKTYGKGIVVLSHLEYETA